MVLRFFFRGYLHDLHLHSFPTRRSSDLCSSRSVSCSASDGVRVTAGAAPAERKSSRLSGAAALGFGVAARSEEHTSELQSRRDLVCRLLLEKKNDQINNGANVNTHVEGE